MGEAEDLFQSFLKQYPQAASGQLSIEEMNQLLAEFQKKMNKEGIDDFDGLSPNQMHVLLYDPLSDDCALQLKRSMEEVLQDVPIFQLSELLIREIVSAGKVKLTSKGNLPIHICEVLFNKKLITWRYMNLMGKIQEDEIPYIWPLKQYLKDRGIVKKLHNTLSLTKNGEKLMKQSNAERFKSLLLYFGYGFHWGNFYDIPDNGKCGQLGWAYSLLLLQKYGDTPRESEFYSEKLIRAFENEWLGDNSIPAQRAKSEYHQAYAVRFFEYFANWFGLVNIERKKSPVISAFDRLIVTKSPVFDRLIVTRQS